ncbi:hypothetical protein ACC754_20500 [Rhizobium johnstonii]|uniref:hypothetical protein n=1 Tax=Rhizobium johnstonii TaxID=3019933 RepID=UPI003F946032
MRKLLVALALLAATVLNASPSAAATSNRVEAFHEYALRVLEEVSASFDASPNDDYTLSADERAAVLKVKQQVLTYEGLYGPSTQLSEVTEFADRVLSASAQPAKPDSTPRAQATPASRPQMDPGAAMLLLTGYSYYLGNRTCEENGFSAPGLGETINAGVRQIISETGISGEAQDFIWAQTTSALVATPPQVDATECLKLRQAMAMAFPKYFPFTPAATEPNPFR